MIVDRINEYSFRRAFEQLRPNNFSYDGLTALYEYLEQLSEDIGEDIELDVIAICCDYSEYNGLKDFQSQYSENYHNIEQIENDTATVIAVDEICLTSPKEKGRFIISNF